MLYSLQTLVKRARLSEDLMLDDGFGCGSFLNMVDEEESWMERPQFCIKTSYVYDERQSVLQGRKKFIEEKKQKNNWSNLN